MIALLQKREKLTRKRAQHLQAQYRGRVIMLPTHFFLLMKDILGTAVCQVVLRIHRRVSRCLLPRPVQSGGEVGPGRKERRGLWPCAGEGQTVLCGFTGGKGPGVLEWEWDIRATAEKKKEKDTVLSQLLLATFQELSLKVSLSRRPMRGSKLTGLALQFPNQGLGPASGTFRDCLCLGPHSSRISLNSGLPRRGAEPGFYSYPLTPRYITDIWLILISSGFPA